MSKSILLHGDAYQLVNRLIENNTQVDHIITDPPYNISQSNNFTSMKRPRHGVDFGLWDSGAFDLYAWIPPYTRLLGPNGSIVIFCSYRYISHIVDMLESDKCHMRVKDVLVWQKSNPMPRNTTRRYVQDMEFAIWAVRDKAKWVFNKPDGEKYARALCQTAVVSGGERTGHPTQKSLRLMKRIVAIHSNIGDTVLDPFMGSGTTGEAALSLDRNFIGIEQESSFFEIAQERLKRYENRHDCK